MSNNPFRSAAVAAEIQQGVHSGQWGRAAIAIVLDKLVAVERIEAFKEAMDQANAELLELRGKNIRECETVDSLRADLAARDAMIEELQAEKQRLCGMPALLHKQAKENAELRAALSPFATYFEGPLDSVGGGTLVSVPLLLQAFKDAQKAIKQ